MIVHAQHPAPLLYVPPRARKERLGFARMTTPVELREDDLSRSVEVGPLFPEKPGLAAEPMRLLDGRLWMPVAAPGGRNAPREATLDEFLGWLAGRAEGPLDEGFQLQFKGSPLVALGPEVEQGGYMAYRAFRTRGEAIDPSAIRKVSRDGRDRAGHELARYLDEEIRVLDGRPFMRCAPVLMVGANTGQTANARIDSRLEPMGPRWLGPILMNLPVVPETLDPTISVLGSLRYRGLDDASTRVAKRWLSLVPQGAVEGDDVRWSCSAIPEVIRRDLDLVTRMLDPGERRDALETLRTAILDIEIAATTGQAHRMAETALPAIREGLETIDQLRTYGMDGGRLHARHIDRVLIPGAAARRAADLDAAGLAGLGMSP